jgi:phage anti-repressor protein
MPLDPLLNKINGRTKRLKKLVVLEKKEKYFQLISEWYDEEFFITKLGITPDYVNGFKYYLVENENFLQVLESKNNQKTILFMVALSQEYKIALNHGN